MVIAKQVEGSCSGGKPSFKRQEAGSPWFGISYLSELVSKVEWVTQIDGVTSGDDKYER